MTIGNGLKFFLRIKHFIFLFLPVALIGQRNVSGKITDARNGESVVGASVFISNTTIGDFTDEEGHYQLKIPEGGSYQLTISFVGYQSVSKDIEPGNSPVVFSAALRIQETELEEVAVVAKVKFRQRDIDLFWRTILGKSPSRNAIFVANPEAVYYYYNPDTKILKVTCREPLQIFDYETGYQIHYVLNNFMYDYNKNVIDWSNQFVFSKLVPENLKQNDDWEKKRREVYNTSLTKFIKSLYNNTLYDDGFVLASLHQTREPNNPYQITLLDPESILSKKSADNSKTFDLSSGQVMLVCYGRPVNAMDLDIIQHPQDREFFKKSRGLVMNLLQGESIRIFPDGTYANKLLMAPVNSSNTLLGLNMRLPFEFQPEDLTPLVAKNENIFDIYNISQHFNKQMEVFPQEKIHLQTDRNIYVPGEKIWFKAYLTDAETLLPAINSRYVYVELINSNDSLIDRMMIRPDNDNMFYGYLFLSDKAPNGDYTLRAYTRYMENLGDDYFFKKNIRIENLTSDITGHGNQKIQTATDSKRPQLYVLTVSQQNGMLRVGVQQPANSENISYYLLGQCRGQVFHFSELQGIAGQARNDIDFQEADLPAGVLQFVLFDGKMNPLNERLVFSKNYDKARVEFHTDKTSYNKREKVIATLTLTDSVGNPLAGNLSVAVTDDKDIAVDSTTTILSSLLLSSELKGYIENPAYYLQDNTKSATALDNLMQTHEWQRYNVPEIVKENYESPQIPFQTSQEISGKVKAKPLSGNEIIAMTKYGILDSVSTDKNGAFMFKDFEYPDSTSYLIKASGKKGGSDVKLSLNEDIFPKLVHAPQNSALEIPVSKGEPNAFILKAEKRSRYDENMKTVQLNKVDITGQKIENKNELRLKFWANASSDVTIRREKIEKMHPQSISDILRTIPGVTVKNGTVNIRQSMSLYSGTAPLVFINGTEAGEAMSATSPLESISVADVESIDVFIGSGTSVFGVRGANGVISVTTKEGINDIGKKSIRESKVLNQTIYTPLGYQTPAVFDSPNYESSEAKQSTIPDYRTTIFWQPDIVVSNSGEASFEFFTSDFQTTYSVVIEGITSDGKIVRQMEKIKVE